MKCVSDFVIAFVITDSPRVCVCIGVCVWGGGGRWRMCLPAEFVFVEKAIKIYE